MRTNALLVGVLVIGVAGCSIVGLNGRPSAEQRLDAGIGALARGDQAEAREHLYPVYSENWGRSVGRRATIVLVALELDPRNPTRRLAVGADMAARMLAQPGTPTWLEPVAETLYLLSLEVGANEERIAQVEAERDSAQALPQLPGPSFMAQLQELRTERDSERRRAAELALTLAAKEKELKEKEQELERIRRTLRG